jgi:hypothetical protein
MINFGCHFLMKKYVGLGVIFSEACRLLDRRGGGVVGLLHKGGAPGSRYRKVWRGIPGQRLFF